jgi:hypothetical protein
MRFVIERIFVSPCGVADGIGGRGSGIGRVVGFVFGFAISAPKLVLAFVESLDVQRSFP